MDESAAVSWLSFLPLRKNDLIFHHSFFHVPLHFRFSVNTTRCVSVYLCVFVFTKEPICWFLVYVLFVFCLARSLTEQIKACCSSGKEQKKNRKSLCLSEGLTRLSYTGILSSSSSSLSVYESQAGCYFG